MGTNVEIEIKSPLGKEEYDKLISSFSDKKIYTQVNYYFDTKLLEIISKKCGLRMREKDGRFELTLKVPQGEGKLEINQQISDKIAKSLFDKNIFPNGSIAKYLQDVLGIKIDQISCLGTLTTKRLDIPYKNALISIDESSFNNIIDYEIEIEDESLSLANKRLKEFLSQFDIQIKKSPGSKLKRFIKTL